LALQFGIKAANYPFTEDDMGDMLKLPPALRRYKHKLFGLTIAAERLHQIRSEAALTVSMRPFNNVEWNFER